MNDRPMDPQRQLQWVLLLFGVTTVLGLSSAIVASRGSHDGFTALPKVSVTRLSTLHVAAGQPLAVPISADLDTAASGDDCSPRMVGVQWQARALEQDGQVAIVSHGRHSASLQAIFRTPGRHTIRVICRCGYETDCSESAMAQATEDVPVVVAPAKAAVKQAKLPTDPGVILGRVGGIVFAD